MMKYYKWPILVSGYLSVCYSLVFLNFLKLRAVLRALECTTRVMVTIDRGRGIKHSLNSGGCPRLGVSALQCWGTMWHVAAECDVGCSR